MQVAFVDMGLDKAGFLCANDIDITEIPDVEKKKIGQLIKIRTLHLLMKKKVAFPTITQALTLASTKSQFRFF